MKFSIRGHEVDFPHQPYGVQFSFMEKMLRTLDEQGNALLEAPTGCGKTLSLLCAALAWQEKRKKELTERAISKLTRSNHEQRRKLGGKGHSTGAYGSADDYMDADDADFVPSPDAAPKRVRGPPKSTGRPSPQSAGSPDTPQTSSDGLGSLFGDDDEPAKPPKIFFASRTHSQIAQVVRELKRTAYKPSMAILAAKQHYCINKAVQRSGRVDEECDRLMREDAFGCRFKSKQGHHKTGRVHVEVHDIEELAAACRPAKTCPYFTARDMALTAELIFCPYSYLLDPVVRAALGVDVSGSVLIFDEAHNIEDVSREGGSMDLDLDALRDVEGAFRLAAQLTGRPDLYDPLAAAAGRLAAWLSRFEEGAEGMAACGFEEHEAVFAGNRALNALDEAGLGPAAVSELWRAYELAKAYEEKATFSMEGDAANEAIPASVTRPGAGGGALGTLGRLLTVLRLMYAPAPQPPATLQSYHHPQQSMHAMKQQPGFAPHPLHAQHGPAKQHPQHPQQTQHPQTQLYPSGGMLPTQMRPGGTQGGSSTQAVMKNGGGFIPSASSNLAAGGGRGGGALHAGGTSGGAGGVLPSLAAAAAAAGGGNRANSGDYRMVVKRWIAHGAKDRRKARSRMRRGDDGLGGDAPVGPGAAVSLGLWCFNPAVAFRNLADKAHSVVLTSGTLAPLDSFASELGTEFHVRLEAPHVVDMSRQVWAGVVTRGPGGSSLSATFKESATFRFQDDAGEAVLRYCQVIPDGVLLFMPSYGLLDKLMTRWKSTGLWSRLEGVKTVVVEGREAGKGFEDAMARYYAAVRSGKGGLFLAVCRGKASEGIDFANEHARGVILLGIPFPAVKDTKVRLKKEYNDAGSGPASGRPPSQRLLSGDAWYSQQAFRALNQAVGRCIRHKYDWGAIILLDERFRGPGRQQQLSRWVRAAVKVHEDFDSSVSELATFCKTLTADPPRAPPPPPPQPQPPPPTAAAAAAAKQSNEAAAGGCGEKKATPFAAALAAAATDEWSPLVTTAGTGATSGAAAWSRAARPGRAVGGNKKGAMDLQYEEDVVEPAPALSVQPPYPAATLAQQAQQALKGATARAAAPPAGGGGGGNGAPAGGGGPFDRFRLMAASAAAAPPPQQPLMTQQPMAPPPPAVLPAQTAAAVTPTAKAAGAAAGGSCGGGGSGGGNSGVVDARCRPITSFFAPIRNDASAGAGTVSAAPTGCCAGGGGGGAGGGAAGRGYVAAQGGTMGPQETVPGVGGASERSGFGGGNGGYGGNGSQNGGGAQWAPYGGAGGGGGGGGYESHPAATQQPTQQYQARPPQMAACGPVGQPGASAPAPPLWQQQSQPQWQQQQQPQWQQQQQRWVHQPYQTQQQPPQQTAQPSYGNAVPASYGNGYGSAHQSYIGQSGHVGGDVGGGGGRGPPPCTPPSVPRQQQQQQPWSGSSQPQWQGQQQARWEGQQSGAQSQQPWQELHNPGQLWQGRQGQQQQQQEQPWSNQTQPAPQQQQHHQQQHAWHGQQQQQQQHQSWSSTQPQPQSGPGQPSLQGPGWGPQGSLMSSARPPAPDWTPQQQPRQTQAQQEPWSGAPVPSAQQQQHYYQEQHQQSQWHPPGCTRAEQPAPCQLLSNTENQHRHPEQQQLRQQQDAFHGNQTRAGPGAVGGVGGPWNRNSSSNQQVVQNSVSVGLQQQQHHHDQRPSQQPGREEAVGCGSSGDGGASRLQDCTEERRAPGAEPGSCSCTGLTGRGEEKQRWQDGGASNARVGGSTTSGIATSRPVKRLTSTRAREAAEKRVRLQQGGEARAGKKDGGGTWAGFMSGNDDDGDDFV